MNCPKCASPLPDDSLFCQYCGIRLTEATEPSRPEPDRELSDEPRREEVGAEAEEVLPDKSSGTDAQDNAETSAVQKEEGTQTPNIWNGWQEESRQKAKASVKRPHAKTAVFMVLLAALLLVSAACNLFQCMSYRADAEKNAENEQKLSEAVDMLSQKNAEIGKLEGRIAQNDSTISDLQQEVSYWESEASIKAKTIEVLKDTVNELKGQVRDAEDYEEKAGYYDALCHAVSSGNLGYADSHFHSDKSIILVKTTQKNAKFTLTANWDDYRTVYTSYSSANPAAKVSFDLDSWQMTTPMSIIPNHVGVSSVTFSNDGDNKTFIVIIIVVD